MENINKAEFEFKEDSVGKIINVRLAGTFLNADGELYIEEFVKLIGGRNVTEYTLAFDCLELQNIVMDGAVTLADCFKIYATLRFRLVTATAHEYQSDLGVWFNNLANVQDHLIFEMIYVD